MMRAIAAALLALPLVVPLRDAGACAAARACAAAPCCVGKNHACPMHRADSHHGCRLRSCGEHDIAIAQAPPAVTSPTAALPRPRTHRVRAVRIQVAMIDMTIAPPEPPPPRRLG